MNKNNEYGPITTDLIGTRMWTEGSGWVIVRAIFFQTTTGFTFLVEDEDGRLLEHNYGTIFTKEVEW